jgi:hypothetical protein
LICKRCFPKVAITQEDAALIFRDVQTELDTLFQGALSLKFSNIVLKVYATDYWNQESGKTRPQQKRRTGFTVSRLLGGEMIHNISLVTGTLKREMAAVCAHEYTHCWLNENCPKDHDIEPDTVEAICELVAYKLMSHRQDEPMMDAIKANLYTNGKIQTAIDCESRVGMPAILAWVKTGKETSLDALSSPTPAPAPRVFVTHPVWQWSGKGLTLSGIVGTSKNRTAMINGQPFEQSEEAPLQVDGQTVMVRCIEITKNTVVVSVDGATNLTLRLSTGK